MYLHCRYYTSATPGRQSLWDFFRENAFNALSFLGNVVESTEEGAAEHIHKMAKKYLGQDRYGGSAEGRRLHRIAIDKVIISKWRKKQSD